MWIGGVRLSLKLLNGQPLCVHPAPVRLGQRIKARCWKQVWVGMPRSCSECLFRKTKPKYWPAPLLAFLNLRSLDSLSIMDSRLGKRVQPRAWASHHAWEVTEAVLWLTAKGLSPENSDRSAIVGINCTERQTFYMVVEQPRCEEWGMELWTCSTLSMNARENRKKIGFSSPPSPPPTPLRALAGKLSLKSISFLGRIIYSCIHRVLEG